MHLKKIEIRFFQNFNLKQVFMPKVPQNVKIMKKHAIIFVYHSDKIFDVDIFK